MFPFAYPRANRALAALSLFLLSTTTAFTADASSELAEMPEIVISATKLPTPENQVGSSITVITAEDIEKKQLRTLPDLLRDVPGLNVVQTGGPGGTTSVFMRGTNANHTKMLVDGIDVSDPSYGSFDLAHLLTMDIERVEVLRGPQSGLYGSDAIGGVINIITKEGKGPPHVTAQVEGGSFGTFNQSAGVSGSIDNLSYGFDFGHFRSTNTPVTPLDLLAPSEKRNDDEYDNKSLSLRLKDRLTDNFDVGLTAMYVDTALLFTGDDFTVFPSVPQVQHSESDTRQLFTRGTAHLALFDGRFDQTLGLGYTDFRRRDIAPPTDIGDPTYNRGDRVKLDWQGNVKIIDGETLVVGAEHQIDQIRNSPVSAQTTNDAGYLELQSAFGDRLFNSFSLRHDSNDRFGDVTTYHFAPSFLITETDTRLKGSVGTGFKGPSLVDLFVSFPAFNFFANPDLKPEESFGWDLGFEQSFKQAKVEFGATWFHNDIDNLIDNNASFTSLINVTKAETYGLESFVSWQPIDMLKLRADYTYTTAENEITGQELLRRPKHKVSVNADWQVTDALSLDGTLIYLGSRIDGNRDFSVPRLTMNGYTAVNIAGSYDLGDGLTAFARAENLFDRQYQDPDGFMRPGIGAYGGLRISFDALGASL